MKCHYEVLGVPLDASDDNLKKSYRKLALKWHPDKNLENSDQAKKEFQLIQAAYEVLSDPQERAWYDKHRDAILLGAKGAEYQENAVNLFEYFTSACYSGYGDDKQSFYDVYGELFSRIAAEDMEFSQDQDSDFEIPDFGDSTSDYNEVVRPFYSYWNAYCTLRPYSWLDKYNIDTLKEVPRRVQRLMEKDNKKLRDAGRKQRNEEVRALVNFVRKRDPRVKAYIKLLEEKTAQNALKTKLQQERHREKRRQLLEETTSTTHFGFSQMSDLEKQLRDIEAQYASSVGTSDSDSEAECSVDENKDNTCKKNEDTFDEANEKLEEEGNEEDFSYEENLANITDNSDSCDDDLLDLYCPACKKSFKTVKSRESHDRSKKHQSKVRALRKVMLEEEDAEEGEEEDHASSVDIRDSESEVECGVDENKYNTRKENKDTVEEASEKLEQDGNKEDISKEEKPTTITADSDRCDDHQLDLHCSACKKNFKTVTSREIHNRSKKHQSKVRALRKVVLKEEGGEKSDHDSG